MHIKTTVYQILDQLSSVLSQLNDDEYKLALPILNDQTIGKHARHIIEFFIELSNKNEFVCYDNRNRDINLETSISYTLKSIDDLKLKINNLDFNAVCNFKQLINSEVLTTNSSVSREMIYCIDHGIHHFAIIKIALKDSFPNIIIGNDFGIAYSTLKFHKK